MSAEAEYPEPQEAPTARTALSPGLSERSFRAIKPIAPRVVGSRTSTAVNGGSFALSNPALVRVGNPARLLTLRIDGLGSKTDSQSMNGKTNILGSPARLSRALPLLELNLFKGSLDFYFFRAEVAVRPGGHLGPGLMTSPTCKGGCPQ